MRDQWCDAFTAAQVSTTEQRVDLIKQQKKYKDKITGTSGDYYLGDQLGEGGFAKVRAAIHAETGHRLAAKIMDAATAAEEEHKRKEKLVVESMQAVIRLQQEEEHARFLVRQAADKKEEKVKQKAKKERLLKQLEALQAAQSEEEEGDLVCALGEEGGLRILAAGVVDS